MLSEPAPQPRHLRVRRPGRRRAHAAFRGWGAWHLQRPDGPDHHPGRRRPADPHHLGPVHRLFLALSLALPIVEGRARLATIAVLEPPEAADHQSRRHRPPSGDSAPPKAFRWPRPGAAGSSPVLGLAPQAPVAAPITSAPIAPPPSSTRPRPRRPPPATPAANAAATPSRPPPAPAAAEHAAALGRRPGARRRRCRHPAAAGQAAVRPVLHPPRPRPTATHLWLTTSPDGAVQSPRRLRAIIRDSARESGLT